MTYARLRRFLTACLIGALSPIAYAQDSGHLEMQVEVLPAALRVTVTSAQLDFAQQRSDAGHVLLDPVTGDISTKVAGAHRLGEVRLTGPAHGAYAVTVTPTPWLTRDELPAQASGLMQQGRVDYRLRWARADGCSPSGFQEIHAMKSAEGLLGEDGCSVVLFGGVIGLLGVPEGRYQGSLHVSIFSL